MHFRIGYGKGAAAIAALCLLMSSGQQALAAKAAVMYAGDYPGPPPFDDYLSLSRNAMAANLATWPGWTRGPAGNIVELPGWPRNTTKQQFLDAITPYTAGGAKELKDGDLFLLFYFGHGGFRAGNEVLPGLSSCEEFLSLPDNWCFSQYPPYFIRCQQSVSDNELTAKFKLFKPGVLKVFVNISCFSGGFWNGNNAAGAGDLEQVPTTLLMASSIELLPTMTGNLPPRTWEPRYLHNLIANLKRNGRQSLNFAQWHYASFVPGTVTGYRFDEPTDSAFYSLQVTSDQQEVLLTDDPACMDCPIGGAVASLAITYNQTNGTVAVSWPEEYIGSPLQRTLSLSPPNWVEVAGSTNTNSVVLAASGVASFFRLCISASAPDLELTKAGSPNPVSVGALLTYTMTVTNRGTAPATNVALVDVLPDNLRLVSVTSSQGSCTAGDSSVDCPLGTLNIGQSASITLVVQPTSAGIVSNTATVVSDSSEVNWDNNRATVYTTVIGTAVQYSINVSSGPNGSVEPQGTVARDAGQRLFVIGSPNPGYYVDTWYVDGIPSQVGGSAFVLNNIQASHTVLATFLPGDNVLPYRVNSSAGPNGSISPSGSMLHNAGDNVVFSATPNANYTADVWYLNGTGVQTNGTSYLLNNIQADAEVFVSFRATNPNQPPGTNTLIGAEAPAGATSVQSSEAGASISLTEGNLIEQYRGPVIKSAFGPTLDFWLTYNSCNADGSRAQLDATLGYGWTHSYNVFLFSQRTNIFRYDGNGRVTKYTRQPDGITYLPTAGYFETVVSNAAGQFALTNKDKTVFTFNTIAGTPFSAGDAVYRLTRISDRNQNNTTLSYVSGKLTTITDTYGRSLTLTHDLSGHLMTVTDPLNRATTLQYDITGRLLLTITDPESNAVHYGYNPLLQLNAKLDKNGHLFTFAYQNGKPAGVSDEKGQSLFSLSNPINWATLSLQLSNNLMRVYQASTTTKTDGRGNLWTYAYNNNGYVTRLTAPDGAATKYTYDAATLLPSSIGDANNHTNRFQYDSLGNRTNVTDALSNVTSFTYETNFSQMTSMTDPNGRTNVYQYDNRGNRTNAIDALGQTTRYTYDSRGNVLTVRDKRGNTTSYFYDSGGNRYYISDALGFATTMTYDGVGNLKSRADSNNHTNTYAYDGLDRLVLETDPLGATTTTTYDGIGNRVIVTDRNTNTTVHTYDHRRRLASTVDALGQATTIAYDGNNSRTSVTDANGHTTTYIYDSQNRLTIFTDAVTNSSSIVYDPVGNALTNLNARGFATAYQYDALNRLITRFDPATNSAGLPCVTTLEYATNGTAPCCSPGSGSALVTKQTDSEGKVTYYKYDALDRLIVEVAKQFDSADVIDSDDAVTTYGYDANGNRTSATNAVGNATINQYDPLNRQTNTINAAGDVTRTTYDGVGNVITVTAPNGNVTTNAYDARDRLARVEDKMGLVAGYTYDPAGNRLSQSDGNMNATTNVYDSLYRLIRSVDAEGRSSIYQYDSAGNLTNTVDRAGDSTSYGYDAVNRRIKTIDSLGHTNATIYDAANNVQALIDGNNHTTGYMYDGLNRRILEAYPDDQPPRLFNYDGKGNVVSRTDQRGIVTTSQYDDLYRLTNRAYSSGGPSDVFSYDLSGRMVTATRGNWVVTFAYDGADRVTNTTQNASNIVYGYNIPGRSRTITYPGGRVITETNDFRGRLSRIDDGGSATPIAQFSYDAANRVLSRSYRNGAISGYAYNANDWPTNLVHIFGTNLIAGFSYDYDNEGNKRFERNLSDTNRSEAYLYDAKYRLTNFAVGALVGSTILAPATSNYYNLDAEGNWNFKITDGVAQLRGHSAANQITNIDATPIYYDANGNLTNDGGYLYTYDEEDRLTAVTRISDARVVGQYQYDALARRVVRLSSPVGATNTVRYHYDEARIIEEKGPLGGTLATYVYGNGIDEVLAMTRGGSTNYFYQNALGSVVAATLNNTSTVSERYTYDAYGFARVTDSTGTTVRSNSWGTPHSAIGNPNLFTGRQLDEEGGLYFYRARYYDSQKGRFLQRDPLGYVTALNLYEYAGGSPVRRTDPSGLLSWAINVERCFVDVDTAVEFVWKGDWTQQRKDTFVKKFLDEVYKAWSTTKFRITPNVREYGVIGGLFKKDCPCFRDGFKPYLHVAEKQNADFKITVHSGPERGRAIAFFPQGTAKLWEADVDNLKGLKENWQIAAVHEFGHLLGLVHPGQRLTPKAPEGKDPDYLADAPALMGAGMEMRAHYFGRWATKLADKWPDCATWWIGEE